MTTDTDAAPVLELRGASFSHPHAPRVLDDVSLALSPGDKVALLGGNGSGKTTLLRLLVALERPETGQLLLDGVPVGKRARDRDRMRRAVQLVLQEPDDQVFSTSVAADVSFGPANLGMPADQVDQRVTQALAAVGVSELAERAPHLLSFGQRKRVALAGVLAMRPRVLLLDEPTAGLDPAATTALLGTLDSLADQGVAVLMATHEVDTAWRWATDAAVLCGGTLTRGPVHRILVREDLVECARLEMPWGAVIQNKWNRRVLRASEL